MSAQEYKVLENKLRRSAERQGFRLERSRARDPRALGYGTYQLVDNQTNTLASYSLQSGYGLDLSDVATFLFEDIAVHVDIAGTMSFNDTGGEPIVTWRGTASNALGTELGVSLPDGWVLRYRRPDGTEGEQSLFNRVFEAVDEAVSDAQEYVRRLPR